MNVNVVQCARACMRVYVNVFARGSVHVRARIMNHN